MLHRFEWSPCNWCATRISPRGSHLLRLRVVLGDEIRELLGLIFLKYISDAFEEKHAELEAGKKSGADSEDPDEYRAVKLFWRRSHARLCLRSRGGRT